MAGDVLKVTARLAAPLAGEPPHLDALLEWCLSLYHPKSAPGYKVDRRFAAPPPGAIPIPLLRRRIVGSDGREWQVGCCSAPILPVPDAETTEHIAKRIGVERAGLLADRERKVIATGNSWTKSYRLPLRVRRVERAVYFAVGDRREILRVLRRHARAIGKKVADGYGVVSAWEVERIEADRSWFADTGHGPLLMRPLPLGNYLPAGLIGWRRDFGAACCPYWHPERFTEIAVPC